MVRLKLLKKEIFWLMRPPPPWRGYHTFCLEPLVGEVNYAPPWAIHPALPPSQGNDSIVVRYTIYSVFSSVFFCLCMWWRYIYLFVFFFVFMFLCFLSAFSLWGRRGHGFILAMSSSFSSISGPYTRMAGELTRWLDKQRSKGIFHYHDSIELKNFPSRVISTICRTIAGIWLKQLSVGLHHSPEPERLVN